MKFVKRISKRASTIPAWVYGGFYLLLVFVFAVVYSCFPQDFYHSTVKYEQSTQKHRIDLEARIAERFAINAVRSCEEKSLVLPEWTLCGNKPSIQIGIINHNLMYFKLSSVLSSVEGPSIAQVLIEADCTMDAYSGVSLGGLPVTIKGIKVLDRGYLSDEETDAVLRELFDRSLQGNNYAMDLPNELCGDIKGYAESQRGFPTRVKGGLSRMFYFSVITQTTLGYGDIVPISDRARTLVGAQSILGIILVGLFLNSLAHRLRYS